MYNSIVMKNPLYISIIIALAIPIATFAFSLSGVKGNNFFGGEVKSTLPCTCPADLATILTVKDKATNRDIKIKYSLYYSRLNMYYNPIFAKYVVGGSMPGDTACRQVSSSGCTSGNANDSDKVVDFLRGIGTSLR